MEKYIPAMIILCIFLFIVYSVIDLWMYKKLTKGQKIAWTFIIVFTAPSIAIGSICWFFAKCLFYNYKEPNNPKTA
jgi:hypothetical protein